MYVTHLFIKNEVNGVRGVSDRSTLTLQRGLGIVGDVNSAPGSPRQILLAGVPALDRFSLQPGQLQENILINVAVETLASGQVVQIGREAQVRLTFLCEPCATLETIQPGLAKAIRGSRGMLGMVVKDGVIAVGDVVVITPHCFPVIPENTRGKFEEFVARIPAGRVVTTSGLLLALGLTSSYYRSIPALIKKSPADLPVHRIVTADGRLLTAYLPYQQEMLLAEGVELVGDRILSHFFWNSLYFHEI